MKELLTCLGVGLTATVFTGLIIILIMLTVTLAINIFGHEGALVIGSLVGFTLLFSGCAYIFRNM